MKIDTLLAEFSEDPGFQMAPMIDITFLLIVFFMVAANVNTADRVDITVPVAEASKAAKDLSGRITVSITADGTLYTGSTEVSKEVLKEHASAMFKENAALKVFLRADAGVKHKSVREAITALADAGIVDIIFSTYETAN